SDEQHPSLAWPDHDSGPMPPETHPAAARDEETTRKPMARWDRMKFIILLLFAFVLLVWAAMANNPLMPAADAISFTVRTKWWLLAIVALEMVRQLHYVISEHSPGYHRFWTKGVFGGLERRQGRISDWNRYRIGRALKLLLLLVIVDFVLAGFLHVSPAVALFQLPVVAFKALPFAVQIAFYFFIIIFQF